MMRNKPYYTTLLSLIGCFMILIMSTTGARAQSFEEPPILTAPCFIPSCDGAPLCACDEAIQSNHESIQELNRDLFREHHEWLIGVFFRQHIGFAMGLMTNEMTTVALQQVKMIGTFFDAKHQLETQRLFQTLMAEAHKDYQPSEGLCDIGTTARALIVSEKKSDLAHQTLANRVMERQLKTGDNLAEQVNSDLYSRIDVFKNYFCNTNDNGRGLQNLCTGAQANRK